MSEPSSPTFDCGMCKLAKTACEMVGNPTAESEQVICLTCNSLKSRVVYMRKQGHDIGFQTRNETGMIAK